MVPCLSSLAPVVLMFLRPAASHTAQAGSEEDLELSWRPGTGQEVRVGWSGSLPVDYSSYSVRAPWDWGLAPRQFFRVCPDHTKTTSWERGPRAHPCLLSVCSYHQWGEASPRARKHTTSPGTICSIQTRRSGDALPTLRPKCVYYI